MNTIDTIPTPPVSTSQQAVASKTHVNPFEFYFPHGSFVNIPGTDGWKTGAVTITPEIAAMVLARNVGNRKLRKPVVGKYTRTMSTGNWLLSPESLILDLDGNCMSAQHRMHAVIESDIPQKFTVTLNVPRDVFKVLDRNATRSYTDALGIPKRIVEVSRIMAAIRIGSSTTTSHGIIDNDISVMAEIFGPIHDDLMEYCGTYRASLSVAGVRAAACARILKGDDPDYILHTYRAMVLMQQDMPPVAMSFIRQATSGKLTSSSMGQAETVTRAWNLFDPEKAQLNTLRITDKIRASAFAEIRDVVNQQIADMNALKGIDNTVD